MKGQPSVVFVVDDDASVRRALGRLLRSLGHRAECFPGGREVLDCDHLATTDCFLLDVHLPGITGWELARELAAKGASAPVIFITANLDDAMAARTREQITLLAKPFDVDQLVAALDAALGPTKKAPGNTCPTPG